VDVVASCSYEVSLVPFETVDVGAWSFHSQSTSEAHLRNRIVDRRIEPP